MVAARIVAFDPGLDDAQDRRDQQIPEHCHHQQRDHLEVAVIDGLRRVEQVRHGDDRDQRGGLDHADELIARGRHDAAHGLRNDDPPERAHGAHPEGLGGLHLAAVDRQKTAANDLGHIGGFVQRQADDGRRDRGDQVIGIPGRQRRAEGNGEGNLGKEERQVIPQDELHQQRRAAEEPDEHPRQRPRQWVIRHPRDGNRQAQDDADDHADHGQPDGDPEPLQDGVRDDVFGHDIPAEIIVGADDHREIRGDQQRHGP